MTSQNQVKISDIVAPAFYDLFSDIQNEKYFEYWLKGGRHSTKSAFLAICIIYGIMDDKDAHAVVLRDIAGTLRNSVLSTLMWAINILDVGHLWSKTVSPMELTYIPTGQKIYFSGLDDPAKLKGFKVDSGFFKYIWFEELAEMRGMEYIRSVKQTMIRGSDKKQLVFYSYNPPRDPQSWVNKEAVMVLPRRLVHHSTYLDVPPEWIGDEAIREAEHLRGHDDDLYRCEYLGESIGLADSVVMNGKCVVQDFIPQGSWSSLMGADWGFANDPNVLVKVWIAPHNDYGSNCLYIEHEAFGYRVDNNDIPELYDLVPDSRTHLIRADCAAPATISQLKNVGYSIIAADKWSGSIEDGIRYMRSFDKIIIHSRCKNIIEESRLWSYKIDKVTKDITTKLVSGYDHGWDSVRYALVKMILAHKAGFSKKQKKAIKNIKKTSLSPRIGSQEW